MGHNATRYSMMSTTGGFAEDCGDAQERHGEPERRNSEAFPANRRDKPSRSLGCAFPANLSAWQLRMPLLISVPRSRRSNTGTGPHQCIASRINLIARMVVFASLVLALPLALPTVANAQTIDAAETAYANGQFIAAADFAEALGTSAGYTLAAQSLTIHAHYTMTKGSEQEALFQRAISLAQKAIQSDPSNPRAHVLSAYALGRHAQTMGLLEAATKGYVQKIRAATDNALRLNPDMAEAHLSLAMWHAAVVSAAGSSTADLLFGASEEDALAYFDMVSRSSPDVKLVPLEYAIALLNLNGDHNREKARELLARAIALPGKDVHDAIVHQRAVDLLAVLDAPDR